ncbi:hypothetical protein [Amycolatopsis jiangsuensis]|uniref:Uncharacterized protein n=1 Tax=Amycolatopsis jiangsuensis TaxID=1181879 RepID=A0A840J514_9PSEU|nr:hypothetical protein [Amycolatopsis jiangsuensis]MBB4688454.1 hypothetical protein [Amycolatopsis jiangsuensis]
MRGQYGYPARELPRELSPEPAPPRRPGSGTAIAAGVLGLVAAVAAGYLPITQFLDIPSGFSLGDLPRWTLVDLAGFLVAALALLVGSVATFFRAVAGAVLLIFGALVAAGAILLEPALGGGISYTEYFHEVLRLDGFAAIDRAVLMGSALIVLLLAASPRTLGYLRFRGPATARERTGRPR